MHVTRVHICMRACMLIITTHRGTVLALREFAVSRSIELGPFGAPRAAPARGRVVAIETSTAGHGYIYMAMVRRPPGGSLQRATRWTSDHGHIYIAMACSTSFDRYDASARRRRARRAEGPKLYRSRDREFAKREDGTPMCCYN